MRLHLIPNSHIDPVWLWDRYEGRDEVLNTFRTACDLLDAFPGLTFSASSLQFYEWVRESDRPLFRRIVHKVEDGRWEVVGSWWVEGDTNLPTLSSLRRQAALGQAFSRNHFGRASTVAYLPDTFGHPATFPSILAECGFTSFIFCRPGAWEKGDLPGNLFHWEHAGAKVLAYRLKHHYLQYGAPGPDHVDPAYIMPKLEDPEYAASPANAYLFGVGDHGGGPALAEIRFYNQFIEGRPPGDVGYSTCERFFKEAAATPGIPSYSGDLHMHAIGCYSVMRRLKQAIREAEQGLEFAARAAALAGRADPGLEAPWKTTLFNQFHDILPGSAAPHAVAQAQAELGGVETAWRESAYASLKTVSRKTRPARREGEFRIFNTLPFPVTVPLSIESFMYFKPGSAFCGPDGRPIPVQEVLPSVRCANRRWEFVDTLPANGCKAYGFDARQAVSAPPGEAAHYTPGDRIGTPEWTIGSDGAIARRDGAPVAAPLQFLVLRDDSDTWGHNRRKYDDVEGRFERESAAIQSGSVTCKLFHRLRYGRSSIDLVYSLYPGLPEVRLEISVHWAEHRKILKLELAPADARGDTFRMQAAGGWVERAANGDELPLHNAVIVPGERADLGVSQGGAFGADCDKGRLRLTLVRSSLYGYDEGQPLQPLDPQFQTDQGEHHFRLRVVSRAGLDPEALERETQAFLEPFWTLRESSGAGRH